MPIWGPLLRHQYPKGVEARGNHHSPNSALQIHILRFWEHQASSHLGKVIYRNLQWNAPPKWVSYFAPLGEWKLYFSLGSRCPAVTGPVETDYPWNRTLSFKRKKKKKKEKEWGRKEGRRFGVCSAICHPQIVSLLLIVLPSPSKHVACTARSSSWSCWPPSPQGQVGILFPASLIIWLFCLFLPLTLTQKPLHSTNKTWMIATKVCP